MAQEKRQPPLLPVYLVVGEDELKRERVVKRLHQRFEQMGDFDFNHERFRAETSTGEEVVNACNTLPFASDVRLVELFDVEKFRKADSEQVIDYLAEPCQSTVLLLVADKLAKNTRLYKAVAKHGKSAVIDCAPMKRRDLAPAVRSMATGHGIILTPNGAATLIDLVGENTVALDAELRKLALAHRGDDPVNENEVIAMVSRTAEVKPWEFIDAFAARNATRCLTLKSRMEKTSSYALLGMCTTRIRELLTAKALDARGRGASLGKVLGVPDWRVKNHLTWSRKFTSEELVKALCASRDTEQAMKSGADPDGAFMDWILKVTAGRL